MTPRKPADPRLDVQLSDVRHDRRHGEGQRDSAEEPISPDPRAAEIEGDDEERHLNVEVESGPVDREEGDDPLPGAP